MSADFSDDLLAEESAGIKSPESTTMMRTTISSSIIENALRESPIIRSLALPYYGIGSVHELVGQPMGCNPSEVQDPTLTFIVFQQNPLLHCHFWHW